jgi:hypothetical protein
MRWAVILMIVLVSWAVCLPMASAAGGPPPPKPGITIMASPAQAHVGDTITLNGTVTGINTIAVYLFVTGPDLDPRGVSLENLNIAAGRGLLPPHRCTWMTVPGAMHGTRPSSPGT